MSQISKRNRNAAKLAFAGVGMITLPLFTLTDASADAVNGRTVIYGNSNAGGSTKITNNADVPDAGAVTTLNSSIRNLQAESNGIIHISPVPTTITKAELAATQAKVNQLVQLVQTYNQNKAQLNAQDNTMESFTGKKAVDTYTKIDGSNLDNALSQMQSINSQMSGMINDNQNTVNKTAQDSATRTTLDDAVKSANQQITNASGSIKDAQDGIYGNMDDVKRKSYDSSQQDGVKVDNTQTQQVNTVKTNVQPVQYTKVSSVSDINNALNNILNNVKNQTVDINNQTKAAGDYKDNALHNIDDVNQWLQNERRVGEQAKSTIDNNTSTAINNLNQARDNAVAALQQIYHTLQNQPNKLPQYIMDKVQKRIDDAVKVVNTSVVKTNQLANIQMNGGNDVDFGSIGTKQDVQNGSTNGTIQNTKDTQAADFQNQITNVINQQTQSINDATKSASDMTSWNQTQINKFLDTMSKGSAFPKSYLQSMDIYKNSPGYKKYIDEVLNTNYDDNELQAIAKQMESSDVSQVANGTPVAKLAAALYMNHQKEIGNGFGSVMFKSTNLNKMNIKVKAPGLILDSRDSGGTAGIYDFFIHHTLNNSAGHWDDNAAVRNLRDVLNEKEYPDGQETSITFVTSRPGMAIKIPDAFVTVDKNGKVEAHDLNVSATMNSWDGNNLINEIHDKYKSIATSGGHPTFIYTFYINKYTGQLIVNTGYIITQGAAVGSGSGGTVSGGGGGESGFAQKLDSTTVVNGGIRILNNTNTAITNKWSSVPSGRTYGDGLTSGPSHDVGQLWGGSYANLYHGGLAQTVLFSVDGGGSFAANAPLYVSDIDDGQQLISYVGDKKGTAEVVTGDGNKGEKVTKWSNPFHESGDAKGFSASNGTNQNAPTVTKTVMNQYSAFVYKLGTGLNNMRVTLRSLSDHGDNYQNISTSFFAPFGVMPAIPDPPKIDVKNFTGVVNTADVTKPTAKAHTEGNYTINAQPMYIQSDTHIDGDVKNMSAYLDLPTYNGVKPTTMTTASNDSFVVRQNQPTTRVTGAGNSLVIRYTNTPRLTASGNSLVIRNAQRNGLTASGNSLVVTGYSTGVNTPKGNTPLVTSVSGTGLVSVDANGKLVMNSLNNAMSTNAVANKIVNNAPVVTSNADGTHTVSMAVYVDPAIQAVAQQALNDWKTALATKGVALNANLTTSVSDLKSGVALAILNSNNSDVRADSQSGQDNLDQIGGLTTKGVYTNLNADNGKAKFNADGTVTAGDALKNAGTVIQLNNQGIGSYQNYLGKTNMNVSILKHELGHSFGLQHVQGDSLMTPGAGNATFTGQISDEDATLAARNLVNPSYRNTAQTSIFNKKLDLTQPVNTSTDSYIASAQPADNDFGTVDPNTGEVQA